MTIADRALALPMVDSGNWFTLPQVARELGTKYTSTRKALDSLVKRGKLQKTRAHPYGPAQYRKRVPHWLNRRRLAQELARLDEALQR